MKILFIIDRIELKYFEFNKLVTNFWLIKGLIEKGCEVYIATIDMLKLKNAKAYADCYFSYINEDNIFYDKENKNEFCIEGFQLVMFRPDPPVDLDYINATYILDFVDRNKTLIMNETKAVRNFNEKLHAVMFNDLMPINIVTSSFNDILEFLNEQNEIIIKPLNQCFGGGVMYLKKGDKNTAVIINQMTQNGSKAVMVQKYIDKAIYGDKRVLFLGENVLPYCVQKVPSNNDFKFCEHTDSNIKRASLSEDELGNFKQVAEKLTSMGIYMAGLDVIDGKIIEINVTSPCYFIKEINAHFNCHIEEDIVNYILSAQKEHINKEKPLIIS